MSDEPRAAAPPAPGELQLLLLVAAAAVLPELFDVDAFKTAVVAVLAAALLLPRLLVHGGDDVRAWLSTAGGRLHLLAATLAVPAAAGALWHAGVIDRLLMTALALLGAVLGLRAAERGQPLARALHGATLVVAVTCLLQSVGLLSWLTALDASGRPEIVGTFGNSTRVGAFLALGVTAAFATLVSPDAREPYWRERLASSALLLGTCALLLTRARGGWLAAAAGLVTVALLCRQELGARWRKWLVPLVLAFGLALVLGDGVHLFQPKLPRDGSVLQGRDLTANVRLAVWRGTLHLVQDKPLLGVGLGRFREGFPPYREPEEAALPGRDGQQTEVDHPHNELLLPFAEGGVAAGACLLAFLLLTLRRAVLRARGGADAPGDVSDRVALALLVVGTVGALLQNAWTTPGTALPFFAAAGWVWRPASPRPAATGAARLATRALLAALLVGLLGLALPRARTHVEWWRFFRDADRHGVNLQNVERLVDAADASPGDVDIQSRLAWFANEIQQKVPEAASAVQAPLDRALARLAELRAAP